MDRPFPASGFPEVPPPTDQLPRDRFFRGRLFGDRCRRDWRRPGRGGRHARPAGHDDFFFVPRLAGLVSGSAGANARRTASSSTSMGNGLRR